MVQDYASSCVGRSRKTCNSLSLTSNVGPTQLPFTCSKSIEKGEKGVKYVHS